MPLKKKKAEITHATTHKDIVGIFSEWFSALGVKSWWKKGANAVRIRISNGTDVIFTFNSYSDWKLESMSMFEKAKDGI